MTTYPSQGQYPDPQTQRTPTSPAPMRMPAAAPPVVFVPQARPFWSTFGWCFKAGLAAGLGLIIAGAIPIVLLALLFASQDSGSSGTATNPNSCIFGAQSGC